MKRLLLATISALTLAGFAQATPLTDAIEAGDHDGALAVIAEGADIHEAKGDGSSPLLLAVYAVDRDLVRILLDHGADPSTKNNYGASPLGEAIKLGDRELIDMLIAAGADVESANEDGQTALMLAARMGDLETAKTLIAKGAKVNAIEGYRNQTALMWAAAEGHGDVVKLLLDSGADHALRAKSTDWLRQMTSEPRAQYRSTGGQTALLFATRSGCLSCAQALVEAGADVNRPNPDGVTPLINAIDNQHYDVARYLLEKGAMPNVWDMWGRTPLYAAVDMSTYSGGRGFGPPAPGPGPGGPGGPAQRGGATAQDVIDLLLEAGVDPNIALNQLRPFRGGDRFSDYHLRDGTTPLLRAALTFDAESVKKLVDHGARVELHNARGFTPMMLAAGLGASFRGLYGRSYDGPDAQDRAIACLETLVAAGADVNQQVVGSTATTTASAPRMDARGFHEGRTPLHGAAERGWTKVAQWLLDHGADPTIEDGHGQTPGEVARAASAPPGGQPNPRIVETADLLDAAAKKKGG